MKTTMQSFGSVCLQVGCFTYYYFSYPPYIAEFYHTPALIPLARYTFLGFFIASLGIAHNAYLFRNLKVKQKAFIQLTGLILSNITGVTLALCGMAYWGIATQGLVYVTSNTILFWRYSGWKPTLHISFKPLKSMINFSCKILITNIFSNINNNMLTVILGRFYSQEEVGYFNQANKWTSMGYSTILGTINGIAQPVLRNVSEDTERQCRVFRKMLRFTAFISFPALFGLSLIAPELITITITDKWNESAIIMQILCIGSAFLPIQNLYSNLVISKGKSDIFMWNTIFLGIIQIGNCPAMLPLWHPNDDFCLYQHQYQLAVRVALLYMERDTPHFMGCTKRCRSFRSYCSKLHGCCLLSHPIYR